MLKTILLLTPIYVTLFWTLLLHLTPSSNSYPKRFLGKFMLVCVFLYIGHFIYFNRWTDVLFWYDPVYQLSSLLVYPIFYVYFRLLMLDIKFMWKKHYYYFIAPVVFFIAYIITIHSVCEEEYLNWIYNKGKPSEAIGTQVLNGIFILFRIVSITQIVLTLFGNLMMIRSFRVKAIQFYSDFWEIRSIKVVMLNIIMVMCGLASIVLSVLGRRFFISELTGLTLASIIFSTSLFIIGWLGMQQKVINPNLVEPLAPPTPPFEDCSAGNKQLLAEKINQLFIQDKIYLNANLTIQNVAQLVGTNRTYISSIINQFFGLNFCSFVNNHRLDELERILKNKPGLTNQSLAEACGFGSIDSLKRAVQMKTGLSVTAWKRKLNEKTESEDAFGA
jgi:AraC-like DNA-binding protein